MAGTRRDRVGRRADTHGFGVWLGGHLYDGGRRARVGGDRGARHLQHGYLYGLALSTEAKIDWRKASSWDQMRPYSLLFRR